MVAFFSSELFARYVIPHFQNVIPKVRESRDWAAEKRRQFVGRAVQAIGKAIQDHAGDRAGAKGEAS